MSTILTDELDGGIGSALDRPHRRLVVAEWGGALVAVSLVDGARTVLGGGYGHLEDVVLNAAGTRALVSEREGTVLEVDLDRPARRHARVVADRLEAPHQIVWDEAGRRAFVVEHSASGRLLSLPVHPRLVGRGASVLATGLDHAVGLALSADRRTAYVTEQSADGGRLVALPLSGPTVRPWTRRRHTLVTGLVHPFMLTWEDAGRRALLVPERDPADRITRVEMRTPWRRRVVTTTDPRPSSVLTLGDDLVVVSDRTIRRYAFDPGPAITFDVGAGDLFPGSWRRVGLTLGPAAPALSQLQFEVVEGPHGGRVSPSHDETFTAADPHVMLLAGHRPGDYTLRATHAGTGVQVGEVAFTVSGTWSGVDGPPLWFDGLSLEPGVAGAGWGGGAAGPQVFDAVPASGTRNVALLFLDTSTSRYPADISALMTEWTDETFDGIPDGSGGTRSVAEWMREVSQNSYDLSSLGAHGPVSLEGTFEDYFALSERNIWVYGSGFFQSCVAAAEGMLDFSEVDSLVVVVQSAPAVDEDSTDPEESQRRFAWPYATGGTYSTAEGNQSFRTVVMPHDWGDTSDREIVDTLTHELGHNLGLPDLYMNATSHPDFAARDVDGWSVMSSDNPLPSLTTISRLRLGWMDPGDVRAFDFAGSGAVDEDVVLAAVENGAPPAGQFSAIEIRLADGWNYYFEYRSTQTGQDSDQALPRDRSVLGTDVISPSFTAPGERRQVVLLDLDPDGDGPVLGTGQDYREADVSDPMFPTDFSLEVLDTNDDRAVVRVRYGASSRPDPSIRPWPGSGVDAYVSPDIEVRNDRNAADPTLANIPWAGHPNTIVAKVKNLGTLLARDVVVDFFVKDFTAGSGTPVQLSPEAVADVAAGDTVEFTLDGWVPPDGGHFCVMAQIRFHVDDGPPVVAEMSAHNNTAQTNYTEVISAAASPPSRERVMVTVDNPLSTATRVHLEVRQDNPFFRTYVGATSVWLEPGEERAVEMMFESLRGDDLDPVFSAFPTHEARWLEPNVATITALLEDRGDPELHTAEVLGGAQVLVRSGVGTRAEASADFNVVVGTVSRLDGTPITGGSVLVAVREPGDPSTERTATGTVTNGHFFAGFDEQVQGLGLEGTVQYLGQTGVAPSPEAPVQL